LAKRTQVFIKNFSAHIILQGEANSDRGQGALRLRQQRKKAGNNREALFCW
jgi:hypothetical protein